MAHAYLIAYLDPVHMKVIEVGIRSENENQLTTVDRLVPMRLAEAQGTSYDAARKQLIQDIEYRSSFPHWAWIRKFKWYS